MSSFIGGVAARLWPGQVHELSPAESAKEDGNTAFKRGDLEGALAAYSRSLELDAHALQAANNRALVLLRLGRAGEAEADCNRVGEEGQEMAAWVPSEGLHLGLVVKVR